MRILFVTEIDPFPPLGGETIRTFNLLKVLQSFASVHLVILDCQKVPNTSTHETPDSSCVESVTYIPKAKTLGSGLIERLRPPKNVLNHLVKLEETFKPDLVWLDYAYIANYRLGFPRQKVIYGTHNVQSEIDYQLAKLPTSNQLRKLYSNLVWKASEYHEHKFLAACDAVITVAEQDLDYYKNFIDPNKLWVIPNFIDLCKYPSPVATKKQSLRVVFTGSMDAFQNQRAGDYLLEQIWPLIARELPQSELFIVGKNPPSRWLSIPDPRVRVTGKVESVIPFLQDANVAIVPILDGSGTRFKILEAMACGVPVVSTPLGCQGIDVQNGFDILVEESADLLAQRTIELLKSPQQQISISSKAYKLVEQKYSLEANKYKLQSLCSMLLKVNNENFTSGNA